MSDKLQNPWSIRFTQTMHDRIEGVAKMVSIKPALLIRIAVEQKLREWEKAERVILQPSASDQ